MKKRIKKIIALSILASSTLLCADSITDKFKDFSLLGDPRINLIAGKDLGNLYQLKANVTQNDGSSHTAYFFITKDKKTIVQGYAYDAKSKNKLVIQKDMKKYEKYEAFKKGIGKDHYYVFIDPQCPACKTFEKEILPLFLNDATFHFFMFPLSSQKYSKILLSTPLDKRDKVLHDMVNNKKIDTSIKITDSAKILLKEQIKIATSLGVNGTPNIFNTKGDMLESQGTLFELYNKDKPIEPEALSFLKDKDAVVTLGSGPIIEYIFTGTTCPHCIAQFKDKEKLNKDLKNKTFHFILLGAGANVSQSGRDAQYIYSLPKEKRAKVFLDIMQNNYKIDTKKITDLGKKTHFLAEQISAAIGIKSTPTIVSSSGKRLKK